MGRRSISSTKTGKFMNPTDQARKEARRKELKKNKKQRLLVRQAVLKGKDPKTVLVEMEALDKLEYDPNNPPPYNVKVLQDKRKKLKETWVKVFKLYEREDPKSASEMKFLEIEYEKRRSQMMQIYESIKQAEKVKLEDIPLPGMPSGLMMAQASMTNEIPLPIQSSILAGPSLNQQAISVQKSILKAKNDPNAKRDPPGPPPGPPPNLTEFECDDDEKELGTSADDSLKSKSKKIRFAEDSDVAHSAKDSTPTPSMSSYVAALKSIPPPAVQANYGVNRIYAAQTSIPDPSHKIPLPSSRQGLQSQQNVFTAPPTRSATTSFQTTQKPYQSDDRGSSLIIEAKPLIRNKMAEITRFVPSALMVRRDQKNSSSKNDTYQFHPQSNSNLPPYTSALSSETKQQQIQKNTKDEAYDLFMKEINKLL